MERLDVVVAPENPDIEAAIHFARYGISKHLVKGKRVLDVACGEGYGAYLLSCAGASEVVGVDVSSETIARAQRCFGGNSLSFIQADAERVGEMFAEGSFDVVISVETIEHLKQPDIFLSSIKRLAKPEGVIVLSCPNDHWYYPESSRSNPYHVRKYRFEEFQDLCVRTLGDNVQWSVGTGVFGFGSTPLSEDGGYALLPGGWMSFADVGGAYLVSGKRQIDATSSQCSYYIGVWNAPRVQLGLAVFPLAMDDYAKIVNAMQGVNGRNAIRASASDWAASEGAAAQAEIERLQHALNEAERARLACHSFLLEAVQDVEFATSKDTASLSATVVGQLTEALREQRRLGLLLAAVRAENETMKERLLIARGEAQWPVFEHAANTQLHTAPPAVEVDLVAEYRIGYERYIRLRSFLPAPARSLIMRAVRALRAKGGH